MISIFIIIKYYLQQPISIVLDFCKMKIPSFFHESYGQDPMIELIIGRVVKNAKALYLTEEVLKSDWDNLSNYYTDKYYALLEGTNSKGLHIPSLMFFVQEQIRMSVDDVSNSTNNTQLSN